MRLANDPLRPEPDLLKMLRLLVGIAKVGSIPIPNSTHPSREIAELAARRLIVVSVSRGRVYPTEAGVREAGRAIGAYEKLVAAGVTEDPFWPK